MTQILQTLSVQFLVFLCRSPAEKDDPRVVVMAGLHLRGKRTADRSVQSALSGVNFYSALAA